MGVRCRLFALLCLNIYAQRIRVSISSLTECASRRPKIQKVQIPAACIQDPTQPHHYPDRQPAYVPSALTRPRSSPGATNSALAFIPPKPKELHNAARSGRPALPSLTCCRYFYIRCAPSSLKAQRAPVHPSNLPPFGDHEGGARRLPRTSIVSERYLRRCRRELQHLVSRIGRGEWLSATVVGRCAVGR